MIKFIPFAYFIFSISSKFIAKATSKFSGIFTKLEAKKALNSSSLLTFFNKTKRLLVKNKLK